ncbi:MAG: UDP-N-acetylmuramoyl-tripeptide--D-alanyl-D-alanine ligase, partial [Elusimicrobia bacterium]|nr:UDP-N-acetylmuramoyl-tripeptide--D-alanyl-D-alanine ligase [Elusimicrobiota bacterium]
AHTFIGKAIEKGSSGLVLARMSEEISKYFPKIPSVVIVKDTLKALGDFASYYKKKIAPVTIAITGSSGKTTTKEIIYSILKNKAPTLASFKNYNNLIGVPLTLFNLKQEHKYCILELGVSVPGEMDRLADIACADVGIITNIGKTHLEYLGSPEQVFHEKSKLFASLPVKGVAVINIDDPLLVGLKSSLKCKMVTYGLIDSANVSAYDIQIGEGRTFFKLKLNKEIIDINLSLPGRFNVMNALAAAAACFSLGVDNNIIKRGLEEFTGIDMRMEKIESPSGSLLINDAYNANPDSMRQAISYFVEGYPGKKKIVVIGDMLELGKYAENEHKLLGDFLAGLPLENIYLYGNMMKQVKENSKLKNVRHFNDQEGLLSVLKRKLNKNTVVLFKASRGMGLEKTIGKILRP